MCQPGKLGRQPRSGPGEVGHDQHAIQACLPAKFIRRMIDQHGVGPSCQAFSSGMPVFATSFARTSAPSVFLPNRSCHPARAAERRPFASWFHMRCRCGRIDGGPIKLWQRRGPEAGIRNESVGQQGGTWLAASQRIIGRQGLSETAFGPRTRPVNRQPSRHPARRAADVDPALAGRRLAVKYFEAFPRQKGGGSRRFHDFRSNNRDFFLGRDEQDLGDEQD